jgi:hypothetical protein
VEPAPTTYPAVGAGVDQPSELPGGIAQGWPVGRVAVVEVDAAASGADGVRAAGEQLAGLLGEQGEGVGAVVAATVLLAWSHPARIRSEAALAALAGASPLPASSGNTTRHRLNRGGERRLNRALCTVALVRMATIPAPATTSPAAPPKAAPNARSCATSSATSAGNYSEP